jgi:hypothetical protein
LTASDDAQAKTRASSKARDRRAVGRRAPVYRGSRDEPLEQDRTELLVVPKDTGRDVLASPSERYGFPRDDVSLGRDLAHDG